MAKRRKRKKSEYNRFRAEIKNQCDRLGLRDWDILTACAELDGDDKDAAAIISADAAKRVATITLNMYSSFAEKEAISVEDVARHEIAHLLLTPLWMIANSRWADSKHWNVEEERLATILEKVL